MSKSHRLTARRPQRRLNSEKGLANDSPCGSSGQPSHVTLKNRAQVLARRLRPAYVLLLLLAGFLLLQSMLPLASAIKIGADEDFALSKALLSLNGYRMYSDFWNDQPPLHTFLLKSIFQHISYSVLAARLLTVAFSLLLLSALFVLVLRINGLATAALAVALLIASPGFLELSASAQVELCGLAPVIAAVCVLYTRPLRREWLSETVAGVLFAVALQIKLIGALYLPLIPLILWLRHRSSPLAVRQWIVSNLRFGLSLVAVFLAINYLTGEALGAQFAQFRSSHFSSVQSYDYGSPHDHPFKWDVLINNWDATLPAMVGVFFLFVRRNALRWLLPLSWLLLTFAVFTSFKPWWTFYFVHTAIPLCWFAAMAIATVCGGARNPKRSWAYILLSLYIVCASVWMGSRLYLEVRDIRNQPQTYNSLVLSEIKRYKPFASFFFASEPVYAFHADMPIPPEIATLSLKRFWSGNMTNARLARRMDALRPDIVLLTSGPNEVPYQRLLDEAYKLVYRDAQYRLYVLPAVVSRAASGPD